MLRVGLSGVFGVMVFAAWLIPAVMRGGDAFAQEVLYALVTRRTVDAIAHARPFYWYLPLLPLVLVPWLLWWPPWRELIATLRRRDEDRGTRFCLVWVVGSLAILSLVGGKQVHYLLPMLPAVALLLSRFADPEAVISRPKLWGRSLGLAFGGMGLAVSPWLPLPAKVAGIIPAWLGIIPFICGIAFWLLQRPTTRNVVHLTTVVIAVNLIAVQYAIKTTFFDHFRLDGIAKSLAEAQHKGLDIAYVGRVYHGQFSFLGRLPRPIEDFLENDPWQDWLANTPRGAILEEVRATRRDELPAPREGVELLASHESMRGLTWQRFDLWKPRESTHLNQNVSR